MLRDSPAAPTFFIFALTELDGARFYGAALTYPVFITCDCRFGQKRRFWAYYP